MLEELKEFMSKTEFAKSENNPLTEAEFNYLFKNREKNGFSEAFLKVSQRNFYIHLPTFVKCLSERLGKWYWFSFEWYRVATSMGLLDTDGEIALFMRKILRVYNVSRQKLQQIKISEGKKSKEVQWFWASQFVKPLVSGHELNW